MSGASPKDLPRTTSESVRDLWDAGDAMGALRGAWREGGDWFFEELFPKLSLAEFVTQSCRQAAAAANPGWFDELLAYPASAALVAFDPRDLSEMGSEVMGPEVMEQRRRILRACVRGARAISEAGARWTSGCVSVAQEQEIANEEKLNVVIVRSLLQDLRPDVLGERSVRASAPLRVWVVLVRYLGEQPVERLAALDIERVEEGDGEVFAALQTALNFRSADFIETELRVQEALRHLGLLHAGTSLRYRVTPLPQGPPLARLTGTSLGCSLALSGAKLLGTGEPWESLDPAMAVCSAGIDGSGRLLSVTNIQGKLAAALRHPSVHAMGICGSDSAQLTTGHWAARGEGLFRDPRAEEPFVAVTAETLIELAERLNGLSENAIRRYRDASQKSWDDKYRRENDPEEKRPQYIESQELFMLSRDDGGDVWQQLSPERFRMRRPGRQETQRESIPDGKDPWRTIDRKELVNRLLAPFREEGALRLVCATHDAGQGKTTLLRWLRKEIHAANPRFLAVYSKAEALCEALEPVQKTNSLDQLAAFLMRLLGAKAGALDDLKKLIEEGRLVFLLDGLDQSVAGLRTDWMETVVNGAGSKCRFVIAGRPQSIQTHKTKLFTEGASVPIAP